MQESHIVGMCRPQRLPILRECASILCELQSLNKAYREIRPLFVCLSQPLMWTGLYLCLLHHSYTHSLEYTMSLLNEQHCLNVSVVDLLMQFENSTISSYFLIAGWCAVGELVW